MDAFKPCSPNTARAAETSRARLCAASARNPISALPDTPRAYRPDVSRLRRLRLTAGLITDKSLLFTGLGEWAMITVLA
ncbi:hypothetical protein Vqi01_47580 [Micromonospora qiuiae]|uniref:Uncharacterized protein n=1 Tax=Micromonospora qiuiae TaxID=502268 RepID=A0ABQ4JGD1_9ACTN|nr:hypothetical protein Vqi01_47580 [Micromonospora qiuiae]